MCVLLQPILCLENLPAYINNSLPRERWMHLYIKKPSSPNLRNPYASAVMWLKAVVFSFVWLFTYGQHPELGVPMTRYGCPDVMTTSWTTGQLQWKSQFANYTWSTDIHLANPPSHNSFQLNTCGLDYYQSRWTGWPEGQYCLFKYGHQCPTGNSFT